MKLDKIFKLEILAITSIIALSLTGCTADSGPAASVQSPPSVAGTTTPTLDPAHLSSSASAVTEPQVEPTPPAFQATTSSLATSTAAPKATSTFYPYGVVYAFSKSDWNESDRQAIREHLAYLGGLGVNTIVQVFSSRLIGTGKERDWLILLDEAERANIHVVARLWPLDDWNGHEFDFQPIQSFLTVVQDHPALLAYLGLHEPLERFDSDQLREFYAGVKSLAPDLPIANYMGDMAWFEKSPRFSNRDFTAGICDICIVWCTPAKHLLGEPAFVEDEIYKAVRENRQLVDERAPDTQLWFLGQTYAQYEHRYQLRMPTPEEMELIYTIAAQERVDGFLWYPWLHGQYDQVLSDPDMEPQRQAVRHIYQSYIQEP